MEKDEETGLSYHHHRYFATWIGRWTSSDPLGLQAGINRYCYLDCQPTGGADHTGLGGPTKEQTDFGNFYVVPEGEKNGPWQTPSGYTLISEKDFSEAKDTWKSIVSGRGSVRITARISRATDVIDNSDPNDPVVKYSEVRFTSKVDPGFEGRTLDDLRKIISEPEGRLVLRDLTRSKYITFIGPDLNDDPTHYNLEGGNAFIALPRSSKSSAGIYTGWKYVGKSRGSLIPIDAQTDSVLFSELFHEYRALHNLKVREVFDPKQHKNIDATVWGPGEQQNIPAEEAITHVGVYTPNTSPSNKALLRGHGLRSPYPELEYTGMTENAYRYHRGYPLRASHGSY